MHQYMAMPDDPRFKPIALSYSDEPAIVTANGSLFGSQAALALYSNDVAWKLGDVITVTLSEVTTATKNIGANYKKDNKLTSTAALPLGKIMPNLDLTANINSDTEFTGTGAALQNNQLVGSISATIVQILPNKNFMIAGEKWVTLASGEEYIRVSGIIRPQDINPDNTISSNNIADARIAYSGTGDLQRGSTTPGWLARLFNATFYPL
jgi:flagellar L-ring protein precursor FlgH